MTASDARIIGHFRVIGSIGAGGMGVVHRAEDTLLRRPVALKLMRPEHLSDPRRRARFLREARTAASLVHPNIATVYEVGEAEGEVFIAMELVPGTSLRGVLHQGIAVPVPTVLRWSLGIARALAKAHQAGIIHRDLKPDNVMILPDDEVKLLDFGIAKAVGQDTDDSGDPTTGTADTVTEEGSILGTPQYMSPEQARGERTDGRCDVFAFGIVVHEALAGRSPFQRATPVDTLAAVIRDEPPPLGEAVSKELAGVLKRCLAKDPAERYASGAELLAALVAVTGGAGAAVPSVTAMTGAVSARPGASGAPSTRIAPASAGPRTSRRWHAIVLGAAFSFAAVVALAIVTRGERHAAGRALVDVDVPAPRATALVSSEPPSALPQASPPTASGPGAPAPAVPPQERRAVVSSSPSKGTKPAKGSAADASAPAPSPRIDPFADQK